MIRPKSGQRKRSKVPSITKLIKECDRLFSIKVRGSNVIGTKRRCHTCGGIFPAKKLQCGHYLSRYYKAARWDEDNARPQCLMCNMWKRGDPVVFRAKLLEEIGEQRVLAVEAKRHQTIKLTRDFLLSKIEELKGEPLKKEV